MSDKRTLLLGDEDILFDAYDCYYGCTEIDGKFYAIRAGTSLNAWLDRYATELTPQEAKEQTFLALMREVLPKSSNEDLYAAIRKRRVKRLPSSE